MASRRAAARSLSLVASARSACVRSDRGTSPAATRAFAASRARRAKHVDVVGHLHAHVGGDDVEIGTPHVIQQVRDNLPDLRLGYGKARRGEVHAALTLSAEFERQRRADRLTRGVSFDCSYATSGLGRSPRTATPAAPIGRCSRAAAIEGLAARARSRAPASVRGATACGVCASAVVPAIATEPGQRAGSKHRAYVARLLLPVDEYVERVRIVATRRRRHSASRPPRTACGCRHRAPSCVNRQRCRWSG